MSKRKMPTPNLSAREVMQGKQYPGIKGKVVHWADHAFEEGILYVRIRFTDNTELCWRISSSVLLEEADLSDWKTGNFRHICIFAENKSGRE
jgi:hypothetical protein